MSRHVSQILSFLSLGEDEKYKSCELDLHGPSTRGWLSNKNCSYPQEILLVLQNVTLLRQMQVLAHHYIIRKFVSAGCLEISVDRTSGQNHFFKKILSYIYKGRSPRNFAVPGFLRFRR